LGVDYHWRAEPIFYGWLPGAAHRYYGGRQQDTVWEIDRPNKSPEHPTMKPVELVQRAVENSSRRGESVLDLFLGSGTTLIACQRSGRVGYGIEISPAYCAVALQRMQDAFPGIEIELVESHDKAKRKSREKAGRA
jgi:DNA modification methylase